MDIAGKMVLNDKAAGWMSMLNSGATTLWETWNGTSGWNSLNHPMFGSVEQWFYRHLLGIQICGDAVGCDKVRIDPKPCPGVTWAKGHLDTPKGRIYVSWHLDNDGRMVKSISVPE
jgi:alpha-L-rhamnosidase